MCDVLSSLDQIRLAIGETPRLLRTQEIELCKRWRKGDTAARERLFKANLPLVLSIAQSYKDKGVDLDDLFSVGSIGLWKATGKWEPEKARLSTYAHKWITKEIRREIETNSSAIHLPEVPSLEAARLRGIDPEGLTDEEIADAAEISVERLEEHRRWSDQQDTRSLQAEFADGMTLEDVIPNDEEDDPAAILLNKIDDEEKKKLFKTCIARLPDRERKVVNWLYNPGEMYAREYSQAEVALKLGITQSSVSKILGRALTKIKEMLDG